MDKPKTKRKRVVSLEEYKLGHQATVKCKMCLHGYLATWRGLKTIEDVHCRNCANQALEIVKLSEGPPMR